MKKFLAVAIGMAMVAGAAYAQSQTYSKNAVGFINIDAASNSLYALTIPFVNMNSDNGKWVFKDTQIAADAPTASTVYFWDGIAWRATSKGRNGFATDYELEAGECFFFEPAGDMTITMSGEVPDEAATPVAVAGAENLSAIGNPYPTPFVFKDSDLAAQATTAATVYFWDGAAWRATSKGRNGFATDHEVQPGEGFFFQTTKDDASKDWDVTKPYEWP